MNREAAIARLSEVKSMRDVLESCFDNDPYGMRRAAEYFSKNGRPPVDLGKRYRKALGTRARGPWWTSVLSRLRRLDSPSPEQEADVDSISQLRATWESVARGRTVVLCRNGRRFARVLPLKGA